MGPQIIIQITVLFVLTLQSRHLVDQGILTEDSLTLEHPQQQLPPTRTIPHLIYIQGIAGISTVPHANVHNVNLLTDVKSVVPVIQHEFAQPSGTPRLPIKSQPWTPIRSFLLERELSFHPDKVFVRQLIDTLDLNLPIRQITYFLHISRQL